MSRQTTMADVAAAAGVSIATVSRVLTGSAAVAAERRRQVHEAISRLDYRPRGTRPRDVRYAPVVTLVSCEPTVHLFHDPFFSRLIAGAERYLSERGGALPVMSAAAAAGVPVIEKHLVHGGSSGVILTSVRAGHPLVQALAAAGVPARCVGRPPDDVRLPYVDVDNRQGARRAVEMLLGTRSTVAHIAGPVWLAAARDRLDGYLDVVNSADRQPLVVAGDFTPRGGARAMEVLLERCPRLDAVFVASDPMAQGALTVLRRAGRSVPGDVAVIGFDDVPLASHSSPALTTVRQPVEELGALAAQLVYDEIVNKIPPRPDQILQTSIVVRSTT